MPRQLAKKQQGHSNNIKRTSTALQLKPLKN
ncbi:hypothetical protein A2U01_0082876, partial [Trifolium medium]|nr:hypothetical protein [Trifolium medium]